MRPSSGSLLAPNGRASIAVADLGHLEENKGFGAMHFAHVLGFNHYNFILAASRAGFEQERTISPTEIIFRCGVGADAASLAADGQRLSRRLYGKGGAHWRYLRHHARSDDGHGDDRRPLFDRLVAIMTPRFQLG